MAENVYVNRDKELIQKIKDLAPYEALFKLASDLKIDIESLMKILAGIQGIDIELGRRIEYLWQIRKGKVHVPVPKAELVPEKKFEPIPIEPEEFETIKGCSYFSTADEKEEEYRDGLISTKGSVTFVMNHRDILTEFVSVEDYDGALKVVLKEIDKIFLKFINERNGNFGLGDFAKALSSGTVPSGQCTDSRKYEFEARRYEDGEYVFAYGLKYSNGVVSDVVGFEQGIIAEISNKLWMVGVWE